MTLDKYWQKRDFGKTPEPHGKKLKAGKNLSFFIQKHHARRLHYDFRLELDGTLVSWAIPKGPSLDPAEKRLAVHVEDHPIEYGTFEGEIPAQQYGAGTVLVWDKGYWIPDGDPAQGLRKGRLKFQLKGKKLSGGWTLVRMGPSKEEKENWLLIKEHDSQSKTGDAADITALQPDSVIGSGKQSRRGKQTPESTPPAKRKAPGKRTATASGAIEGTRKAEMPELIAPQLATLAEHAPAGDDWLSEIKFDGYRALCRIDSGAARLFTRAGNDWTNKWDSVAAAAAQLPVKQAWLDGEVVAVAEDGSISFQLLQNIARDQATGRLVFYVFDLLYLNGYDLRDLPLVQRKQLLKTLLADTENPILFSDHVAGNPKDVFSHACMHGLEGIVVKRADARYESDRSRSWLKVKCQQRQEFVIGGYTDPAGSREKFGALLLGVYDDDKNLHYAGRVGTGFDDAMLRTLAKEFSKLSSNTSPFVTPPPRNGAAGIHWVKPKMVAEVKFAQWTEAGVIRHASFVGLRSDKPAREIRHEQPLPINEASSKKDKSTATTSFRSTHHRGPKQRDNPGSKNPPSSAKDALVAGVRLSHPSRVLFPDVGLTKLQLAQYYEEVADWVLPHLADRPLTLVRCPHGGGKQCFFQKHANETTSADIERIEVPSGEGSATYMTASSLPALISLVQMGVLELHTWGARKGHLDQPDRMIFDLDPAPDLPWTRVVEAAQLVRSLLDEIGLTSFVKTTGGKGLHVVIPLKPERSWDEIKTFSRAIAEHLANTLPDRFTSKMTKTRRTDRIFIDYLRNAVEATAVAAYSTRARPGAPVSIPISWEELSDELRSDTFRVTNIRTRLCQLKEDPWAQYFQLKQRISAKMLRAFGLQ